MRTQIRITQFGQYIYDLGEESIKIIVSIRDTRVEVEEDLNTRQGTRMYTKRREGPSH